MKKNNNTGWKDVYQFTIAQNIKNKSYLVSTVVITLFVVILCMAVNLVPALVFDITSSKKVDTVTMDTLYVYDHSGRTEIDYTKLSDFEEIPEKMEVIAVDSEEVTYDEMAKELLVTIGQTESGYEVAAKVTKESGVSKEDAATVVDLIADYFRQVHCEELQLTQEQIAFKDLSVNTSVTMLGEKETNFIVLFVEYIMNFVLIMVFMLLINSYGKMSASIVAMEKSSKVMELLLTSVRPFATILGKVLAMSTLLMGQIVLWIVAGLASFFGSNAILGMFDSKYAEGVSELLSILKEGGITLHFSPVILLVAIAIVVTGFTIYIAIASFFGATVGKIEELGQSIQMFSFLAIAGAYIPLFGFINMINTGLTDNTLLNISRIVPICSLYIVPSEMILGLGTVSDGLLAIGINLLTLVIIMMFVSKVYESVILYSGNRLKLKDVIAMSKNK